MELFHFQFVLKHWDLCAYPFKEEILRAMNLLQLLEQASLFYHKKEELANPKCVIVCLAIPFSVSISDRIKWNQCISIHSNITSMENT